MALIESLHFIRPWWFLALLPAAFLFWRLHRGSGERNLWANVVDAELLASLTESGTVGARSGLWRGLTALTWLVCITALAGPSWERKETPTFRNIDERVIVIDLSRSMDANDIKPSRLIRVRQKVEDILAQSAETENAMVVFAASPFVVSPLTNDAATIQSLLATIRTDIMPAQGSRTALGLRQAHELLLSVKSRNGRVILFTDSPVDENAITAAAALSIDGLSLSVIGVGTDEGAPVPLPRGGFLKDRSGNIVVARLDQPALERLAKVGNGEYRLISNDESDIEALLQIDFSDAAFGGGEESQQVIEAWLDRGPWLMLLLILPVALVFRRGWV